MKNQLKIFIKVAQHLSFTLASKELNLSQPAVSKSISKLEKEYNTNFFIRSRNSISLTNEGKVFLDYAYRIISLFEELENSFLLNQADSRINFELGLSTTIATYIMPKVLAKIQQNTKNIQFNVTSSNTSDIERKILDKTLDFGIVEGKTSNQILTYTVFTKDEIVLVTSANNHQRKISITPEELTRVPFVSREMGSGTRDIIEEVLKRNKIKSLNTVITLNSTEAIEQYLYYSDTYALLSIHAVTEKLIQNKLRIVDIKGLSFEREFYFVHRTGYQSKKMDLLRQLINTNYNF